MTEDKKIEVINAVDSKQQFGEGTVGVSDDVMGKEILMQQKEHGEKELDTLKKTLEAKKLLLDRYTEQWVVEDERWGLILKGCKRVNPEWEYEQDPRYNELQTKVFTFKYENEAHMAKAQIKKMEYEMDDITSKIENQEKELESITEDLK